MLRSSRIAIIPRPVCRARLFTPQKSPAKTVASKNGKPFRETGFRRADVVVETVTVTGTETLPALKLAEAGVAEQVVPAGAPLQTREAVPVKPLPLVSSERL